MLRICTTAILLLGRFLASTSAAFKSSSCFRNESRTVCPPQFSRLMLLLALPKIKTP